MIIKACDMIPETRENMRGGKGSVQFRHPVAKQDLPAKSRLFAEIIVPSGSSMGYHEHMGETEFYYILEGEGILNDDTTCTPVTVGDTVITGNGGGHSVENESGKDLKLLACIILD